ncbi:MAG: hypothetical protein ACRDNX_10285, partial [Gaiellaceae bacterium]
VAVKVQALARERGISFKQALNSTLRRGLSEGPEATHSYRLATCRMGLRQGIDLDQALALAAELEDAETIRKLELRK